MSTTFPTAKDTFNNLVPNVSKMNVAPTTASTIINQLQDSIAAVETKVGVDSSAVTTSLDYKLSGVATGDKAMSLTGTETGINKRFTSPKINENVVLTSTSTQLNQLSGNNGITGSNLATSAIKLGYTAKTSNFSTASGTAVQVTGLTSTVTIPAGGRGVKITVFTGDIESDTINQYAQVSIWDGTVGSGTQLAASTIRVAVAAQPMAGICMAFVTPAAGSKTYNVGLSNAGGSGTAGMNSSATAPSFILVELI